MARGGSDRLATVLPRPLRGPPAAADDDRASDAAAAALLAPAPDGRPPGSWHGTPAPDVRDARASRALDGVSAHHYGGGAAADGRQRACSGVLVERPGDRTAVAVASAVRRPYLLVGPYLVWP